jgi:hypothetical protein
LEGVIQPQVASRTALRIRGFLSGKQCVAPFVVSTILKAQAWKESIQAGGSELLSRNPTASVPICDLIPQIAESLIEYAPGTERQLLSRSLQEALFCCLGFDTDLTSTQIKTRLKRFFRRHTPGAFIQQFLSLYFFNCVCFHTADWFSDQGVTPRVFEKDMEELDRICQKAVVGAYKHVSVLSEPAAEELIRNIEHRLMSCCHAASRRKNSAVRRAARGIQRSPRLQSSRARIVRFPGP